MRPGARIEEKVLNLTEAARFIRVSEKTLREMARARRLPCQKVGREWRFLLRGLEDWLAGARPVPELAGPTEVYRQATLFTRAETTDDEETGPGFGDTSFTKNRREPLHRWVPWIAGFSAAFVEEVLNSIGHKHPREITVLDPFAGVGTTLVEAMKRGYNVVGFEINPYAALACEVKLSCVQHSLSPLTNAIKDLESLRRAPSLRDKQPLSKPPRNFQTKTAFFSLPIERQVLLVRDFIANQTNSFVGKILNVALGAVMVGFSNYSYEPSLSTRAAAGKHDIDQADVLRVLSDKLWEIEADISFLQRHMKRFQHKPSARVYRRSYLEATCELSPSSVDLLVTSPPYLNNYHYVRNTRPQLYWLGLAGGNGDLKKLEEQSFGRFWQTVRGGPTVELAFELPELQEVLERIRHRNPEKGAYGGTGWAKYATTYFNDCDRFFKATRPVMKRGRIVVVVIGNNIVQGIHVETDRFLAQIAELHGFRVQRMHRVRSKRTGSSIVNSSVRAGIAHKPTELYETAVELRAPE